MTRTDPLGRYQFEGLPPGNYLLLSSFDLDEITEDAMMAARAVSVSLDEGRPATQDLELYRAP